MKCPRNPIRSRFRLDSASSSHPRHDPRRATKEVVSDRETLILVDAHLHQELGEVDYALCRLRELGHSWSDIAQAMEALTKSPWSRNRTIGRTRRAMQRYHEILDGLREEGNGAPVPEGETP